EAARSEYEGDGASDIEAVLPSAEEAKPPNILVAGAGSHRKAEAARSPNRFSKYYTTFHRQYVIF
ncbi:hypothetical protein V7024_02880, partial [Bacillus sp. JJ864]|uniref:hypothetical protein n=1 Tax=Bacillus sp. JJ864 TaxID=3122975 RepID=UPI002FFF7316